MYSLVAEASSSDFSRRSASDGVCDTCESGDPVARRETSGAMVMVMRGIRLMLWAVSCGNFSLKSLCARGTTRFSHCENVGVGRSGGRFWAQPQSQFQWEVLWVSVTWLGEGEMSRS